MFEVPIAYSVALVAALIAEEWGEMSFRDLDDADDRLAWDGAEKETQMWDAEFFQLAWDGAEKVR